MRVWQRWTVAQRLRSAKRGDNNQDLVKTEAAVLAGATSDVRSDGESNDYLG